MRATSWPRITIVLAALMVSACAGLRPDSDPMAFALSPTAPASPALQEGVSLSINFDAALRQAQDLRKRGEFDSASRVLGQLIIAAPNDARLESGHTEDVAAKAVGPSPTIASASRPAAGPAVPSVSASRAPPVQASAAREPKRTERAATPRLRPAGVARAITRTATIPLAATSPAEPWELMIRVSLPPPSAAVERPTAVAGAIPPTANRGTEQPSGWSDALERWSSAVLGFFGELWLRAFPDRDPEVA